MTSGEVKTLVLHHISTAGQRWALISEPSLFSWHHIASSKQDSAARTASNEDPAHWPGRPSVQPHWTGFIHCL